jgi:DNA-binding NtrC family response regulator
LTAAVWRIAAERMSMAIILLVEDDVFVRNIAEMMIGEMGHKTIPADDMEEALGFLHSGQPIDALVTDIRLKSATRGGFELAQQAIRLRPQLRVLYVTGNSVTAEMSALFVDGGRFLQKPYSETQLQQSVEKLLAPST